jgi:NAD(P)-dependent dehydrogenase (short-subunit alcohol dehydrogenase family)
MANTNVALVTGGTDGIGKATAKRLLTDHWEVVIIGRDPVRCENAVAELKDATGNFSVSALTADLSLLGQTRRACDEFAAGHDSLDFLFLNANAISQRRTLTIEGFESNLALGFLSRALMAQRMEGLLSVTPGSQILSVVGLNKERLDFDDPSMERKFSGIEALGRWQWAVQMYSREFNRRSSVPMNIYMPGIVKTKILDSEPNLAMRMAIKAVYAVRAVSTEESAGYVYGVMRDVQENQRRDAYYSVKKLKGPRGLGDLPGDQQAVWELTQKLLEPYMGS